MVQVTHKEKTEEESSTHHRGSFRHPRSSRATGGFPGHVPQRGRPAHRRIPVSYTHLTLPTMELV